MEFIEYSLESLRDESIRLAKLVEKDGYRPDCVAYLARGGWIIGETVAEYFRVPVIELSAHRSGDSIKERSSSLLAKLPSSVRKLLRELEINHRLKHDDGKSQHKTVRVTERYPIPEGVTRVLLVDDSADTGASIAMALSTLKTMFSKAVVRVAVINTFSKALESTYLDWWLYEEYLLSLPSSKDSKEYDHFAVLYEAREVRQWI